MDEQVIVRNGVDLGWITITGEDASTNVASTVWSNGNAITDEWGEDEYAIPIFWFDNGSTGPVISQVFTDPNEDIYEPFRIGVMCTDHSYVKMIYSGMNGFDIGCLVTNSSTGIIYDSTFNDCEQCVFVDNNSNMNMDDCTGDCEGICVLFHDACTGRISGDSAFSNGEYGILIDNASSVRFTCQFTNCYTGIRVNTASIAYIEECTTPGYTGYGVLNTGGHVYIAESNLTKLNDTTTASTNCSVGEGGITTIWDSTSGISQTKNVLTSSGIIFAQ